MSMAQTILESYGTDIMSLKDICKHFCTSEWEDFIDVLYTTYVFSDGSKITLDSENLVGFEY